MQPTENFLDSRQCLYKRRRNEDYYDELHILFNKKFRFRFENAWKLPDSESWFSTPPWKLKSLEQLKLRLNYSKSQLNDFNLEEWSSHTRRRNPAGEVCWKVRCLVNPEFLTQAWTKFYECASTYNIVPNEALLTRKIVSLHLCEAPGAFITSLNHYLKSNYPDIDWKWLASTLNPYYEGNSLSNMISDDRFMFHTLDNWDFGEDKTGNLMDWKNSQAIVKKAQSLGKVLLVTADGSIDCLQKPDAQEEVTSPLHYCEIITALQALSRGGTFIFKLFTIFEHSTVNLIYLLNQFFAEVNIYKPVTSRQGNSEVYAVCLNYKGFVKIEPYINKLQTVFGTDLYGNTCLFPLEDLPASYLKQVEECASYFCSVQRQVINTNLQAYLFQNNIALHTDMKKIRAIVAAEYIRLYNLRPLPYDCEILKGILHEENKINTNPRYHRGSYTERQLYTKMSLKEKVQYHNTFLKTDILSNILIFLSEPVKWEVLYDKEFSLQVKYTYGCPLQRVNSSKFIFVPIYKLYQQILADQEFTEVLTDKSITEVNINSFSNIDRVLSLPEFDSKECYDVHEKRCFNQICDTIRTLDLGETVLIENFCLLTHFNVSIAFILSKKCFEKTGFTRCGRIILSNLTSKGGLEYLGMIEKECERVKQEGVGVLNTLPVQITNDGPFFIDLIYYNNTVFRNKCASYLRVIENSI